MPSTGMRTTLGIVEWVEDMVGQVGEWVKLLGVGEGKFIRVQLGGHLREVQLI